MALIFSRYFLPLSLSLFAPPCLSQDVTTPRFEDISVRAGLTVSHIGSPEKRYIVESTSGGVGFTDCDNDGKLDILMAGGSNVDHFRQNGGDPMVRLFRQDSDLHFIDVTEKAGLTRKGWGMGISVMDYDNDGLPDIYVTGFGGNVLYHNLGNCKFEDVTEKAGVRSSGYNMGPAWADYDRSGYVTELRNEIDNRVESEAPIEDRYSKLVVHQLREDCQLALDLNGRRPQYSLMSPCHQFQILRSAHMFRPELSI